MDGWVGAVSRMARGAPAPLAEPAGALGAFVAAGDAGWDRLCRRRFHHREGIRMYELSTEYWFDSAHFLTDYHGKCENLHGHQWRVTAYVRSDELGPSGTERDMVVDFATLKRIVREECDALDHTFLVEEGSLAPATLEALASEGFSLTILPFRTTSENLARYLFDRLSSRGLPVCRVDCNETPNNRASYAPGRG